ncbi:HD domain-containing protein [Thermodesulfovibrionales bacterium]|nr:HD domain-containing protein [Thermodesulfovibrionales bacterium]
MLLRIEEIKTILKPQFGFLGKSIRGEPLWVHAFTLWSIASKIIEFIPRFDDRERRLLEITTLIHDIGKMSDKNQSILSGQSNGRVRHTQTREQIKTHFEKNNLIGLLALSEEDIDFIYHAHLHHDLPEYALKTAPPGLAVYSDIIRYADWLASQERLDRRLMQRISSSLEPFCQITAVHISRPEGPSNYLLFDTAYNFYGDRGWDILIVFPDSLLLIAPKDTPYPAKDEVIQKFQELINKGSLSLQKPNLTNFAAVLLAGESAKNPGLYLDVHKDLLKDALSDYDRAPSFFFKLLIEMLDISGKLTSDLKKKYPLLDILKGLCGTRGIPIARKKWQEMGGKTIEPLKEMLKEIFGAEILSRVIPNEIIENGEGNKTLKNIAPDKLYCILYDLSQKLFPKKIDIDFQQSAASLISMEEDMDFRKIAIERFEKYKQYKETHNPEKGICESCGFTTAFSTQKSLHFPGDKCWGFSQISPHADSARSTCTLCTYDTMILRSDLSANKKPVYIRIESKTRGLWALYGEITKLMQRLDAAFYNPYTLETLESKEEYGFLPLPGKFKMPGLKEPEYISRPIVSVRGYLIPIWRVDSGVSPKDMKARYMSLYALLLMMGFKTHIGFEEQEGLFGDKTIAKHGESYESLYYRGLAIKWLARLLGGEKKEKQNAHVFAEALLTKSPSVAITKIGDAATDEKMRKKINKEQLSSIVETIVKGEFNIKTKGNGGEYTMKELLEDAAFFAEGIPAFIWGGDDHKAWIANSSKHLITKPVSKTMNCVLQGDDYETAFAKLLALIKEDISSDKTKEGSLAKVDIKDLKVFVERTKEILKRYYDLRQNDISAFIQAKNALLSSIYLLKRYPNIKEVVND